MSIWDVFGPGEGGQLEDTTTPTYQDEGTWPSVSAPATSYQDEGTWPSVSAPATSYQDEGTWPASAAKAAATEAAQGSSFDKLLANLFGSGTGSSGLLGGLGNFLGGKAGVAGLMAILAALDRQGPTGGGADKAYAGPGAIPQRTIVQGKYGPIAKYAAEGGLMHAYNTGGRVQMEDGGFVMTKKAVDGAGGADGIRQLIPGARMIRGPGTGTSDSIPAVINSPRGQTPAALSNGEAYINKDLVQRLGGAQRMYEMMHKLQRRA